MNAPPQQPKDRFNKIMAHMEAIASWLELEQKDQTLIVDVGDLELAGSRYTKLLDELLEIDPVPENRDEIAQAIANIWAHCAGMQQICHHLKRPLDHLTGLLCDDGDDNDTGDS